MHNAKSPLYATIAQAIADGIERGAYRPGQALPTQAEYAQAYRTSPSTVKKAFALLVQRGLITPVKGHGTVVNGIRTVDDPSSGSLRQNITDAQEPVETVVLASRVSYADPHIAAKLGLEVTAPYYLVQLLRRVRGQPFILQRIAIQYATALQLDLPAQDLAHTSLYALHQSRLPNGRALYVDKALYAVHCPAAAAERLGLGERDPVLLIESRMYDDSQLLEYNESYERTDLHPHHYRQHFRPAVTTPL